MKELYYPLALKLKGRTVLVVGGGKVALRKVKTLLRFGARIHVVSPDLTLPLKKISKFRKISWSKRVFKPLDIEGVDLIIAATSDETVNRQISNLAKKQGTLINVVDKAELSSFISPALLINGKAIVTVHTNGRDPVLSRDLKNFLKENWNAFLSYRNKL